MTDKERDDAMIAKANENWQAAGVPLPYPDWLAREVLHLERSNWRPAPKPDRAEVLAGEVISAANIVSYDGYYELDEEAVTTIIRRHFDGLRAEWEAERLEIPTHKHYSTPLIERLNGPHEWGYRDPVEGGFIADMSPFEASDRLSELEAERPAVVVPSEDQIKHMTNRFLGWKLPEDFRPDDGISFEPEFNKEWNASQGKPPQRRTPTGTNLFSYTQAEAMVRYMLGDDT